MCSYDKATGILVKHVHDDTGARHDAKFPLSRFSMRQQER